MSTTITAITGEAIADSRGIPTLLITVTGSDGSKGSFAVPSGASTGIHEAYELRDGGGSHGGVTQALHFLTGEIAQALVGKDIFAQQTIDELLVTLDGTANKSRLGGNTLIGVSIALCKAAARASGKEVWEHLRDTHFSDTQVAFPRLYANLINGGKHAATSLAFQEYHIVPKTMVMKDALHTITSIQEKLHEVATLRFGQVVTGDEGGYALPCTDVADPLVLLQDVVDTLGLTNEIDMALDVAASSFFDTEKGVYMINGVSYTTEMMTSLYIKLAETFPLLSIEDPFEEEAFDSFATLKHSIKQTLRVGDDLTTTSKERLMRAFEEKSVDALIIKPNQIGTLTETIETMKYAHDNGIKCIISHRSGETLDDFIADLAYASGAFGIKAGARGPQEREAKYARLLAIESSLQ